MRFKIRQAEIDGNLRLSFDLYGEQVVALVLGLGSLPHGTQPVLIAQATTIVLMNQEPARKWLLEKHDLAERHATRLEICEWAILLFVIFGVILDICNLINR